MTKVVAEIGCNHLGDIDIALAMINHLTNTAKDINYIKFQKRSTDLLEGGKWNLSHPNPENSFGKTYGDHRRFLEFSISQHRLLANAIRSKGKKYACSVWDKNAVDEILSLNVDYLKVPSALNNDFDFISYVLSNSDCPVHISLGMLDHVEINNLCQHITKLNYNKRVILYACTTGYPIPVESICLEELRYLKKSYETNFLGFGFSGHHNGIAIDSATVSLGAEWIERHYTLNKNLKGTDHKCSLLAEDFNQLIKNVSRVNSALTLKNKDVLIEENKYRQKLGATPQ